MIGPAEFALTRYEKILKNVEFGVCFLGGLNRSAIAPRFALKRGFGTPATTTHTPTPPPFFPRIFKKGRFGGFGQRAARPAVKNGCPPGGPSRPAWGHSRILIGIPFGAVDKATSGVSLSPNIPPPNVTFRVPHVLSNIRL